jgi:hypothetical protein
VFPVLPVPRAYNGGHERLKESLIRQFGREEQEDDVRRTAYGSQDSSSQEFSLALETEVRRVVSEL